ncbi:hypothetical protein [Mesorhizobium sp.]|uniref:hypothetical protein n=1 Tax=Mesorhizobium sp. TaxID=1871066 RepID=UPI000FE99B3C|nr:hypothetical protein [Mesorhizobium sp.]RWO22184.1 MAG: hypothetical protein EOS09_21340 [Mesorhizobium sp.]
MDLRLDLATTNFAALAEKARAMIPALEPNWTDHNIHDPGIMLTELLAWTAEAQIYSLSRLRRDERIAYARLLGIALAGPKPSTGLIWPLSEGEAGYSEGTIFGQSLQKGTPVAALSSEKPAFRLRRDQYLTGAKLVRVTTRSPAGEQVDVTGVNQKNGATFLPFGDDPASGAVLTLRFSGVAVEPGRQGALALGFEVDDEDSAAPDAMPMRSQLAVSMRDASGERAIGVLADTTFGMRRSGVLMLDISPEEQQGGTQQFELSIRPRTALARAPRLVRAAANALDVEQAEAVMDQVVPFGTGLPDQRFRLSRIGRMTDLRVSTDEGPATADWSERPELDGSGPADRHFVQDVARNEIIFGNGINGMPPPAAAALRVEYEVCAGAYGNVAAGVQWSVPGVLGAYGTNTRPFAGGRDAIDLGQLQSEARASLSQRLVHVTPKDLEDAARALSGLRVARAHELGSLPCAARGTRTLLVVPRSSGSAPSAGSDAWIGEIRARLRPGMSLGERLDVIAPRLVQLRVRARLLIAEAATAERVIEEAQKLLREKFLAQAPDAHPIWMLGRDVTALTVKGWLRGIRDVLRVLELELIADGVAVSNGVKIGPAELPVLESVPDDISAERRSGREAGTP